ncbi:MAG: beta-glucuronidase [Provencibacterium sp.]|nr:beta-glucuronidase [Provencibacterium sp.]
MLSYSMLYPRESASRQVKSLNGIWKFCFDPKGEGEKDGWAQGLPDPDWIPVPSSFSDLFTNKEKREYAGDIWYETSFFLPESWRGKQVDIRFGCATHRATIYLNGEQVTFHEGGFLPFCARITGCARYGEENRLCVRLNNELSETTLPCGKTVNLADGRKMNRPYFDFFNYSGLQRPVWLTAVPKESVFDFTICSRLEGRDAWVEYTVVTTGEHPVAVELSDESGAVVARAQGKCGQLHIPFVRLWRVRDAYLYRFTISITGEDGLIDSYSEPVGIRTVQVRGEDILLNGEPVYLTGFGKHEDSDIIGRGFSPAIMKRDFELMKWINANSFRTAHYPYSEEILQAADREGYLVIDEVAAVGMFESLMNFMEASTGKKSAFFEKPTTGALLQNHLQALEELITRDKNHACVIMWSLFNEPETTDEAAIPYFEAVFRRAHELDRQKRPRTFPLIMNSLPESCQCFSFSDVISLNRYYGWYLLGGNELLDARVAFEKEMEAWQALKLQKPFLFTEYGADTAPGVHRLPGSMWSEEYQTEYLKMCHEVFDRFPFVRGEQVWNFADFMTTQGIMRLDGNKKGIFTRQRQPKAAAFYLKERWSGLPAGFKSRESAPKAEKEG